MSFWSDKFISNFNVFSNTKITLYYSVYMRTSGEKVRSSDEAERVQSVSYFHRRPLSRLYTASVPLFLGVPSRYFARKYSSFLVKNFLSVHIIFSEPHHTRNAYSSFKGAPSNNCNVQAAYSALQGRPTATALCKYSAFKGTTIATVMCISQW